MVESSDTHKEAILVYLLSNLRPYSPLVSVDHNVKQIPTPVRRYQIYRKPPKIFTFEINNGYHVARRKMKSILTGVITTGGVKYYQYLHGRMLNQDDTLFNALPNCQFAFKDSKKHYTYNPKLSETMAGIHKWEFKESINKKISNF